MIMYMYLEELLQFDIPDHWGMNNSSIYFILFLIQYMNSFIHRLKSCTEPGQQDLS